LCSKIFVCGANFHLTYAGAVVKRAAVDTAILYKAFGARLAQAREAAGITQQSLAEKVGLSRASIANIEAGRQRVLLHQAIEIGAALRLSSIADLLPLDFLFAQGGGSGVAGMKLSGSELSGSEADSIARIFESI
jgi:DNA-binding XRE family transcriptional regulator